MGREKQRDAASAALIALREAMGKTQQAFAVEELNCAVPTIGRYETTMPPRGDVLLRLAEIADRNRQLRIANTFRTLYLDEVFHRFGNRVMVQNGKGYLLQQIETPEEMELALVFQQMIAEIRKDKRKAAPIVEALRGFQDYRHPAADEVDALLASLVGKGGKK